MRPVLTLVVLILLVGVPAFAQMETATLSGVIQDPKGAVVPDVEVTATRIETGTAITTKTNGAGIYFFTNLMPGHYHLQISRAGFKAIAIKEFELHVQDKLEQNFSLEIGSISEVVTVNGDSLGINTTDGSVGTVIDRNFVSQLPLNGRSFNTLLQLTPGVVIAPSNTSASGQFSINGQRTNANYFTVDGVSANFGLAPMPAGGETGQSGGGGVPAFNAYGGTSGLVSVDALQEFRVETSSFAAEYGRAPGGQVIIETRSGTNQFHGGIFDYFRNTVLDANDWFNNAAQPLVQRPPERQNDFGGFFGGPIYPNKTFFFFSYEGLRLQQPQTKVVTVPSLSTRTSAVAAAGPYLDAYPKPNGIDNGDGTAQFTGSWSNQPTLDATSLRIDHMFSQKWTLFGRYNDAPSQIQSRSDSLSEIDTSKLNARTFTLGLSGALTPRLTNTLRGNYSFQKDVASANLDSFGGATPPDPKTLLPSPLSAANSNGFFTTFDTTQYFLGSLVNNEESQVNLVDDLSVSAGSHQLKCGADYRRLNFHFSSLAGSPSYFALTAQGFASNAMADFFANQINLPARILFHETSLYGQDAWRIGPRLVLTYGLRWEFNPAPSGGDGTTLAAWSNTDNPQATALAPVGTPLWKSTYDNFAPRVGIAYRLTSKGDFVVRGGWGLFYDLGTGTVSSLGQFFPNTAFIILFSPVALPLTDVTAVTPAPPSLQPPYQSDSIIGFSPTLELPYSQQWNVALEKSFWGQQAISLTYVGQVGRRLLRQEFEIQPNSNFTAGARFRLIRNGDTSDYHALQVQYRRPLSKGLQALLNYTWSHSIDTASDDSNGVNSSVVFSPSGDRGSSSFDVRHNFSGALTWELPHFVKPQLLTQLSKNWSLNAVVEARSELPINVTTNRVRVPGAFFPTRPDLVPGVPFWLTDPTAPGGQRLNAAAFSIPQQPRQGTLGRNAVPGFGFTQADLSVGRRFDFTERFKLQFRTDLFNVFNHPNFANPRVNLLIDRTTGKPVFQGGGIATQMLNQGLGGLSALYQIGGPRSVQLSLKLLF